LTEILVREIMSSFCHIRRRTKFWYMILAVNIVILHRLNRLCTLTALVSHKQNNEEL
jgi:uncharacterized membrane protein YhaH (DUF805 family)